jgi:phytoene synthase
METLDAYDVTVDQLRNEECTPAFREAIQAEVRRAEQLYRQGVAGIEHLPKDCQFAVVLAATLYAEHHRLIRKQDFDVLSTRPSLSTARKLWVVSKTWWNWRRFQDPVTVFRRVSPVPETDAGTLDAEETPHVLHPE